MNDCFFYDYTHMNHVLKDNVKQGFVTLFINVVLIECLYKRCLFEIELKRSHDSTNSKQESPSYEYDLMISYLRKELLFISSYRLDPSS